MPTDDPDRNAGPTLALLAGHFALDPARTHPMPAADGVVDASASAATYAKELGDTRFDICLLGVGAGRPCGVHLPGASLLGAVDPDRDRRQRRPQASCRADQPDPVGVVQLRSGVVPGERVRQGTGGLPERCGETSPSRPRGSHGGSRTLWLVDRAAAEELPYFECSL